MPPSKFETLPGVVLEKITLLIVSFSFLGPPSAVLAVSLLSKTIWKRISWLHLYAEIFPLKFDTLAATRRLGSDCGYVEELAGELTKRFMTLKRIRSGTHAYIDDPELLRVDLWTAYLMFLESEENNSKQLIEYAKVDKFAFNYVSLGGTLHQGTDANRGWMVDNENNALGMWLFWFTDKQRVQYETQIERRAILRALAQLFVGSFKYPLSYAPITTFLIPPTRRPLLPLFSSALSLAASPLSPACIIPDHYGFELTLAKPLIMPPALLSSIVRFEALHAETFYPTLLSYAPQTRAAADEIGWLGPTIEDYQAQLRVKTCLVEWDEGGSERHETDWMRMRTCYDAWSECAWRDRVFTPGMLQGKWVGRWYVTPTDEFDVMIERERAGLGATTPHPPVVFPVPMQMNLWEHHQRDNDDIVEFDDLSCDGVGKGVLNAWFPEGTTMNKVDNDLHIYVPDTIGPSTYRTYDAAAGEQDGVDDKNSNEYQGPYGKGVWDIILTAKTDERFGAAWGHKTYYGRVRDWDGLVVLVRESTGIEGKWIFYGYVHGERNLVGRWRETGTPVGQPGWSGVWCMTKVEDIDDD